MVLLTVNTTQPTDNRRFRVGLQVSQYLNILWLIPNCEQAKEYK